MRKNNKNAHPKAIWIIFLSVTICVIFTVIVILIFSREKSSEKDNKRKTVENNNTATIKNEKPSKNENSHDSGRTNLKNVPDTMSRTIGQTRIPNTVQVNVTEPKIKNTNPEVQFETIKMNDSVSNGYCTTIKIKVKSPLEVIDTMVFGLESRSISDFKIDPLRISWLSISDYIKEDNYWYVYYYKFIPPHCDFMAKITLKDKNLNGNIFCIIYPDFGKRYFFKRNYIQNINKHNSTWR